MLHHHNHAGGSAFRPPPDLEGEQQTGDIQSITGTASRASRQAGRCRDVQYRVSRVGAALLSLALQLIFTLLHIVKVLVVIVDVQPITVHLSSIS